MVSGSGETVFTTADITAGQVLFNRRGLMQYGSIVGHGAYLGPDYTADYLRRSADFVEEQLRRQGSADPRADLVEEFRTNRYDKATGVLTFTDNQVLAFEALKTHYGTFFGEDSTKNGLIPRLITDPQEIHQLTAFFGWTAWAAAAERPGHDYSYTNNWPAEPRVDNGPTADLVIWSVLSLVVLLVGTGGLFAVYGRWSQSIGWHSAEAPVLSFRQPGEVALTPSQRATAWFFFVIAGLFLVQALLGAAAEHYRADLLSFFGVDLARLLPFNLARTWHVQLSLLWTAAGFLAAGIFLTPFIGGREPKRQSTLVYILFGAVVVVTVGSLLSEALSIHGVAWAKGPLFEQQWEYLDLPRVWQILLDARALHLDCDHLPRNSDQVEVGIPRQHAVAVLLLGSGHSGLLCSGHVGRERNATLGGGVLAFLGGSPVGGRFPRAVHDGHGGLHLRHARSGA